MRRLAFPDQQQDPSVHYCTVPKGKRFHGHFDRRSLMIEPDNFLCCLGCVTDWQQETRGLFL
jgi:hypothetical protein